MNTVVLRAFGVAGYGCAAAAGLGAHLRQRAHNADVRPATPRLPAGAD